MRPTVPGMQPLVHQKKRRSQTLHTAFTTGPATTLKVLEHPAGKSIIGQFTVGAHRCHRRLKLGRRKRFPKCGSQLCNLRAVQEPATNRAG